MYVQVAVENITEYFENTMSLIIWSITEVCPGPPARQAGPAFLDRAVFRICWSVPARLAGLLPAGWPCPLSRNALLVEPNRLSYSQLSVPGQSHLQDMQVLFCYVAFCRDNSPSCRYSVLYCLDIGQGVLVQERKCAGTFPSEGRLGPTHERLIRV